MKIIDAHSHIDYISHLFQNDISGTVVCATQESEWKMLIDLCAQDNNVYGAFGIHPWFVDFIRDGFDNNLKGILQNNCKYMVGEIGLDKYKPCMEKQMDVFIKEFNIAVELKRTVFVHCVGAWDKMLHILKQYKKSDLPMIVFHAFDGGIQIIDNLLENYENNVMFSFGKNVVYGRNCNIEHIPLNKILVESDGKQDVPLINVVNKIAEIKKIEDVSDSIYNNTLRIVKK